MERVPVIDHLPVPLHSKHPGDARKRQSQGYSVVPITSNSAPIDFSVMGFGRPWKWNFTASTR